MGIDFNKLREEGNKIDNELKKERFEELPVELIHLLNNDVINHVLHTIKASKSKDIAARNLTNWIKSGVIVLDDEVQGKVKRFDKVQCVWLNIVEASREIGIHLDTLRTAHQKVMVSEIPNFGYLKLGIICTALYEPQRMMLNGDSCAIEPEKGNDNTIIPTRKHLRPYTVFPLTDLIKQEFPKADFELSLEIKDMATDEQKLLMLFLLRTGAYDYMKVHLSESDVRLVEESQTIVKNEDLYKAITDWGFHKIEIILEDGTETVIENNLQSMEL